jgi:predicted Zn finger-like uncharacterized protein
MYTQCPHCLAVFRVRANALSAARGVARCGRCHREFDALASLTDTLPGHARAGARANAEPGGLGDPVGRVAGQPDLFVGADAPPTEAPALAGEVRIVRAAGPAPSFTRGEAPAGESGWWWFGALLLALALAIQLAWIYRAPLLADARVREAAEALCRRVDCALPTIDDRSRITLVDHSVEPHPSRPHALKITGVLVNQSALPQSLPLVELVLSDTGGRRVAMRRFLPEEYLDERRPPRLEPGRDVRIDLEVEDPGGDAVNFQFAFR